MNNLENLFIPTELSKQLIELGFDKNECIAGKNILDKIRIKSATTNEGHIISWDKYDSDIPLILWDQVINWFDTKGIFITIKPYYNNTVLKYGWLLDYGTLITGDNFNSRYEAIENVIITAIELYEITLKDIENYENNNNT